MIKLKSLLNERNNQILKKYIFLKGEKEFSITQKLFVSDEEFIDISGGENLLVNVTTKENTLNFSLIEIDTEKNDKEIKEIKSYKMIYEDGDYSYIGDGSRVDQQSFFSSIFTLAEKYRFLNLSEVSSYAGLLLETNGMGELIDITLTLSKDLIETKRIKKYSTKFQFISLNILKLSSVLLPLFEKICKTNPNLIKNGYGIEEKEIEIEDKGKLNKTIELPKYVVKKVKELKIEESLESLQHLNKEFNGNDVILLIDFLEGFKPFLKSDRDKSYLRFINKFTELVLSNKAFNVKTTLEYLIRQSFYHNHKFGYGIEDGVNFPSEQLTLLLDVQKMAMLNKWKSIEKYPSDIEVYHDILMKNSKVKLSNDSFKNKALTYQYLEYIGKNYTFVVPENISELVEEGNQLNHCVADYAYDVIIGKSKIVFMRDNKNLENSFLTVELDKNDNIIHAKKKNNEDPTKEDWKNIKSWISVKRKGM